ncbi:hypothetical protein FOA52_013131, partial [Chlamydomonas sp. UWO 241]
DDISRLQDDARLLRPAIFIGVPRVWERVRESARAVLASRTPIARAIFKFFYDRKLARLRAGVHQGVASWLGDWLVFSKLGGRLKMAVSGAAALSPDVEEFIRVCLGCPAGQGYGLTESCSATCVAWADVWEHFGTVGPPQTCVDVRLESVPEMGYDANPLVGSGARPAGELLLRGPCLFDGYYKNAEATAEAMDVDGFFRTGDIAQMEPGGALRIFDRKKNLIKLSQGEYVAVEKVEAVLRDCPFIAQAMVHAQPGGRRLVALMVPRFHALLDWAGTTGVDDGGTGVCGGRRSSAELAPLIAPPSVSIGSGGSGGGGGGGSGGAMQRTLSPEDQTRVARLCGSAAAREHVLSEARAASVRAGLAGFESVYAVRLLPSEWTPDNGFLTPSHKLVRRVLARAFAADLAEMEAEVAGN